MRLYHGTTAENLAAILEEGLEAPSYWGTLDEADTYSEGVLFAVDEDEFENLVPNDLLVESLREQDPEDPSVAQWDASDKSWQECLRIFGSVRCDAVFRVNENHLQDADNPTP